MATKELSIEDKLDALFHLQTIHTQLDSIEKLRGELPLEVLDLEDELVGMHTRVRKIEVDIEEINEKISSLRNTAKEAENGIKKYEKQLNNVKNNREFDALNKEVENLKLDVALAEKRARDFTEEINQKNIYIKEIGIQIENKNTELANKKNELVVIIQETSDEEKKLKLDADKAMLCIEERLMLSYTKLRSNYRNGLAVVSIERDSCGGCFAKIPPQRQSEIRSKKKIIVCEYCGRILAYQPIPVDENAEVEEIPKKKARTSRKK